MSLVMLSSVYLDFNATTPVDASVCDAISNSLKLQWANPSSFSIDGKNARAAIETARSQIAEMINAQPSDIVFTSGGTEASNMVIKSAISSHCMEHKPHVITSCVEHDATIKPIRKLEADGIIDVSIVALDKCGMLRLNDVLAQMRPSTVLVSLMLANNETGVIFPIMEVGRELALLNKMRLKEGLNRIMLHTDAAQAIGKIPVDALELAVDYMTIVGHKFYGPRIGCVYAFKLGKVTQLTAVIEGGGQERGYRPGTENTPMIVGLGVAASLVKENLNNYMNHMSSIRDYFEDRMREAFSSAGVRFNCSCNPRLPNTSSVSIVDKKLSGIEILKNCKWLVASTAAACHAQVGPSHILLASGVTLDLAASAIRISIGRETTIDDIDCAVADLKQAAESLSPM